MSTPNTQHRLEGLPGLEARLRQDLAWLALPAAPWVPRRSHQGQAVLDVAIIGAGMAGLAAAASLNHLGVRTVNFDRAPRGQEGPWTTSARMPKLRTPKHITGPALGLPALTFRAWFEAQFGVDAWSALETIPRLQWRDYLDWYRQVLAIDVRNEHRVCAVKPCGEGPHGVVTLDIASPAGQHTVAARHVVFATGMDGPGEPALPAFAKALPRRLWAHTSERVDYSRVRGKRVGVVGAGASAMDNAAAALDAGASSVDLLIRRATLPRVSKGKGASNPGATHGHVNLPAEWKWRIRHYIDAQGTPPPRASVLRVSRHPNARWHFDEPVRDVSRSGEEVHVRTGTRTFVFDFLVLATGFRLDIDRRPEIAPLAPYMRRWRDRWDPAWGEENHALAGAPDLGADFEFLETTPGVCPGLSRIHCFCAAAVLSHGAVVGNIPGVGKGALRLAAGIAARLYKDDVEHHFAELEAYDEAEIFGDEWAPPP
ncbi:flavin-containing monooxygenase [Pandoraea oxalativorans]|uniref:FAD-dependent oxidoreductase n=1 Tax=Pandoraea oxalativorans TaxID=573737 RepID=A0A0G3IG64_9BURK|nr:NAD(P)/FAD-dependent oxidoreductase [Pandoraea oxalativorans]AKK24826.1 FAD-dependent oxidoreductase [Pandoraea oxalativorans]